MKADWGVTIMHIHNLGAKKGEGGQHHALDGWPSGYPTVQEVGWAGQDGRKILTPHSVSNPGPSNRSKSLYRLATYSGRRNTVYLKIVKE
jgi:hypothetical protein